MTAVISSSNDWPNNLSDLRSLDFLLRCGICCEYFKNCMMTKCSHNFCSYCIRKYMITKSTCPSCFQATSEPELLSNRVLDDIIKIFVVFRDKCINMKSNDDVPFDEASLSSSSRCRNPSDSADRSNLSMRTLTDGDMNSPVKVVFCPICNVKVPHAIINSHVDACLSRPTEEPKVKTENPKREYLTKRVYKLMKEKDLREALKKFGLSTKGNKEILVNRHRKFVILYNADCDSEYPKPVSELVKQIEEEETAILENANSNKKVFKVNCSSHPDEIDKERIAYLKDNKEHYDTLVQQAQVNTEKNVVRSNVVDDGVEPSTSGMNHNQFKIRRTRAAPELRSSGSFSSTDSCDVYNRASTSKQSGRTVNCSNFPKEPPQSNSPCPVFNSDSEDIFGDTENTQSKSPSSRSGSSTDVLENHSDAGVDDDCVYLPSTPPQPHYDSNPTSSGSSADRRLLGPTQLTPKDQGQQQEKRKLGSRFVFKKRFKRP